MKVNNEHICIKPVGITPKVRAEQEEESSDHFEIDISGNMMDLHLVVQIYSVCLEKYQVMKTMSTMGLSLLKTSVMHFISFKSSLELPSADVNRYTPNSAINKTLLEYGLQLVPIPGDGNEHDEGPKQMVQ